MLEPPAELVELLFSTRAAAVGRLRHAQPSQESRQHIAKSTLRARRMDLGRCEIEFGFHHATTFGAGEASRPPSEFTSW